METLLVIRRSNAIQSVVFFVGLSLATVAFGQVRNDRLFNDIMDGGVDELSLSLAAGIDPGTELLVSVPGSGERAVSLLEIAMGSQNDDAAAQLLRVGARVDPLAGGQYEHDSPLELFAQQGVLRTLTTYIDLDNRVLIENGGDAFLKAVAADQMPTARVVLDRTLAIVGPSEIQAQLDEALVIVAGKNDVAATQMLLERGADPGSGEPLIVAVAYCSPDTVEVLLGHSADALPSYEGKPLASYAQRCFSGSGEESEEDAVDKFSKIVQLMYEADSTICPGLADVQGDESSRADSVLENLGICQ